MKTWKNIKMQLIDLNNLVIVLKYNNKKIKKGVFMCD